jgi:hypothetical protein
MSRSIIWSGSSMAHGSWLATHSRSPTYRYPKVRRWIGEAEAVLGLPPAR